MTHPAKPDNILGRLLRHNVSLGQMLGYALSNLIGLVIVITAMQFYRDVMAAAGAEDSFIASDYMVISKKVEGLGGTAPFTPAEVADIKAQPWAASAGAFKTAGFNVGASVEMGGGSLSTALFLEAIPDEYFDITPEGWADYDPASGQPVPVVISKDYLTLYNFGFAASRGLPQMSEQLMGAMPLRLMLSGGGRSEWMPARIAGFSSRLNTIAVPERFMDWANARYGDGGEADPSRLIVRLSQAGDPAAMEYIRAHGYETAGDREAGGKTAYFLSIATGVVAGIGTLISLLALFILILSIRLLLQKNRAKLHDLMMLGYTPASIAALYRRGILACNAAVLGASCAAMTAASLAWRPAIESLGASGASLWPTLLTALALAAAVTLTAFAAVSRNIRSAFR
ncbi:MAG: ABC transporter permease [Duncaniella sp.]|nr:ABC transporter permease [Duncaniella sp.]